MFDIYFVVGEGTIASSTVLFCFLFSRVDQAL